MCNVLVIDDDPLMKIIISKYLTECKIYFFPSGEDAIEHFRKFPGNNFSFAFIDLCLPGISGKTLIDTIKLYYKDLKIFIITGFFSKISGVYLDCGEVDGVIGKPLEKLIIQSIVDDKPEIYKDKLLKYSPKHEIDVLFFKESSLNSDWINANYDTGRYDAISETIDNYRNDNTITKKDIF